MKKLIAITVGCIALCTSVQAQSDTTIDPMTVARGFVMKPPTSFDCSINAQSLVNDKWEATSMQFTIRKSDFAITKLTVNGVDIPLPKPIFGIPMGNGGHMKSVNLNVSARSATGAYAGYGYTYLQNVVKGDRMEVVLRPGDIKIVLPLPSGIDPNDVVLDVEGFFYGYGYGSDENGNFAVYLPPIGGSYHYTLRKRSDGTPLGQGVLEPFKKPVTANDSYVAIKYIGNVVGVEFPNDRTDAWFTVEGVRFDCEVPTTAGTNMPGKVIFTDVDVGGLALTVWGDVSFYVYHVTDLGDMVALEIEDHSISLPWGKETRVNTVSKNVGKVVVAAMPNGPKPIERAWIGLQRYYVAPWGGGDGGGLGRTVSSSDGSEAVATPVASGAKD